MNTYLSGLPAFIVAYPGIAVGMAVIFGVLIGSFLNVVILRWPARLYWQWRQDARAVLEDAPAETDDKPPIGLVKEPSRCPSCGHHLSWWENLPFLSFVFLRGRCRACKTPISWQYPLVEFLGGAAAATAIAAAGPTPHGFALAGASWALIALAGIDLRTMLLPDPLVYCLLWSGLFLSAMGVAGQPDPVHAIAGAGAGYLSLWSVYWLFKLIRGKEGMGYGDFKLLAALGAWTGPAGLLPIVLGSAVIGALAGIIPLLRGKPSRPYPFGPFLAAAGFVEMVWPGWLFHLLGVRL